MGMCDVFFFNDTATTEIYTYCHTLFLHYALPISSCCNMPCGPGAQRTRNASCLCAHRRSEEHTSELQSLMRISYAVFCLKKKIPSDRLGMQYFQVDISLCFTCLELNRATNH